MKIVFVGAGTTSVTTAQLLLKHGHEVIIIDRDENRIREVSGDLDCGFLVGDGTRPDLLKQADPEHTDLLLCLTDQDQENILASLIGKTLGIARVVTKLEDPEFETVATALDLETVVVPVRTVARSLSDLVEGKDSLQLSSLLKDDVRLFSVLVQKDQVGPIERLDLPDDARVVWLYRDGRLIFSEPTQKLEVGDEIVILARRDVAETVRNHLSESS